MSYSLNTFQHKRARAQRERGERKVEEGHLSIERLKFVELWTNCESDQQIHSEQNEMQTKAKEPRAEPKRKKQILLRAHRLVWPVW